MSDYIDIEPGTRVVRIYRDGSWLEDTAGGKRQRASFPEGPSEATRLRKLAAWIRTPGNIDPEDAIDSCARLLENNAMGLSGASPQAEELRAANVSNLREMVGMAGRHREMLLAVRECILALSPGHRTGYDWNADPLFLTLKEGRALNLIDDALKATPASPQAETQDYIDIEPDFRVTRIYRDGSWREVTPGGSWRHASFPDTAPVSPVEPEPPTTCRCLDCEPLTNPGPKPSEDDIDRLEKAAWDSKTDRVLVWYRDRAEMFRQRLRETERAWQLDRKKPTVEPEPCVWRDISTAPKDGTEVLLLWHDAETGAAPMHRVGSWHSREQAWCDTHRVLHNQQSHPTHWTPLPGAPLKVER